MSKRRTACRPWWAGGIVVGCAIVGSGCSDGGECEKAADRIETPDDGVNGPRDAQQAEVGESGAGDVAARDDAPGDADAAPEASPQPGFDGALDEALEPRDGDREGAPEASRDVEAEGEADGPEPASTRCGDGIRDKVLEECDDGQDSPNDSCTTGCRVASQTVHEQAAADGESLGGQAAHTVSATEGSFGVVYLKGRGGAAELWLAPYSRSGVRGADIDVGAGYKPSASGSPSIAGVSGSRYAVAWTDRSKSDGADVLVRMVDIEKGTLGEPEVVDTRQEGARETRQDADILWSGQELVVAWTTLFDAYYRLYDDGLKAKGPPQPLVVAPMAQESNVAVFPFEGGWAVAVRATLEDGTQVVAVKAGEKTWATPAHAPGAAGDSPVLVSVEGAGYLLVYSTGEASDTDGGRAGGHLHAAWLDAASPGSLRPFDLTAPEGYGTDLMYLQERPSAARVGDKTFLTWEARTAVAVREGEANVVEVVRDGDAPHGMRLVPVPRVDAVHADPCMESHPRAFAGPVVSGERSLLVVREERCQPNNPAGRRRLLLDDRPMPLVVLGRDG